MYRLIDLYDFVRSFMTVGGDVLWLLAILMLITWSMMLERFVFYHFSFKPQRLAIVERWESREDKSSWYALSIRRYWLSKAKENLDFNLELIKAFVAISPMVGLMGTVTGMIAVFDIMATVGTSNARVMAAGISLATIPTLGGMVAALSGRIFYSHLASYKVKQYNLLYNSLTIAH